MAGGYHPDETRDDTRVRMAGIGGESWPVRKLSSPLYFCGVQTAKAAITLPSRAIAMLAEPDPLSSTKLNARPRCSP